MGAFPIQGGGGGGFSGYEQFLSSDTFVVPAGVFTCRVKMCGGGGNGAPGTLGGTGGGGGSAAPVIMGNLAVRPGQTLTLIVGAPGGGVSSITDGLHLLAYARGGNNSVSTAGGLLAEGFSISQSFVLTSGGAGGNGSAGGVASFGDQVTAFAIGSTTNSRQIGTVIPVAAGGAGGAGSTGGGGGGGSSLYGIGGVGGAGSSPSDPPINNGSSPPSTSYGAGGGGGGEGATTQGIGAPGQAGIIELWY